MKIKNIIMMAMLSIITPLAQSATFTIQNSSWRDIFVKASWLSSTTLKYVKLPAGKSLSYNSGLKNVEGISWITYVPNKDQWVEYEVSNPNGKILDALKVTKLFRIYPDGNCEHNFGSSSVVQQAKDRKALGLDGTDVSLMSTRDPFLVVENTTNGLVLITPPVSVAQNERGLTSGGLDCIAPGGSKIYKVGTYVPGTSGASLNTKNISCHRKNLNGNGWYYSTYSTTNMENSGSSCTVPGKMQILDNGNIKYKLSYNGKIFEIKSTSAVLTGAPAQQCQ